MLTTIKLSSSSLCFSKSCSRKCFSNFSSGHAGSHTKRSNPLGPADFASWSSEAVRDAVCPRCRCSAIGHGVLAKLAWKVPRFPPSNFSEMVGNFGCDVAAAAADAARHMSKLAAWLGALSVMLLRCVHGPARPMAWYAITFKF